MSDSPTGDPAEPPAGVSPGVLASLPHTRPQRASARRAAARAGKGASKADPARAPRARSASGDEPAPAPPSSSSSSSPRPARRRARRPPREEDQVPRQGYEAEPDSLAGPVQPPGSAELVSSASELAGELAKASVTAGARLVKDLLSRLPG